MNTAGDAHDDGEVDEVGRVLGIGTNLESDACKPALNADTALDANWNRSQRSIALVPHHRKVLFLRGTWMV